MSLQETIEVIENSKLAAGDKDKIVRLMQLLAKSSSHMSPDELQAARVAAGLTVEQAVKLIGFAEVVAEGLRHIEIHGLAWFANRYGFQWSKRLVEKLDEIYGLGDKPEPVEPPAPFRQKIATLEDAIGKIVRCTDGEVRRLRRFDERGDGIYEVDTGSSDGKRAHWMELGATYRGECKQMFVGGEVLEEYQ